MTTPFTSNPKAQLKHVEKALDHLRLATQELRVAREHARDWGEVGTLDSYIKQIEALDTSDHGQGGLARYADFARARVENIRNTHKEG